MTEISGGNLSKTFVVVDDIKPQSPFEGQIWRDTSNQTTKQYVSGTWESIQTSGDNLSIGKNGVGEIEVIPSGIIDNKTLRIDSSEMIRSPGAIHSSNLSQVVTFNDVDPSSVSMNVNLNPGEYGVLLDAKAIGYMGNFNGSADGNTIPSAVQNGSDQGGSYARNFSIPSIVFEDTLSIEINSNQSSAGLMVTYAVIQE